MLKVGCHLSSAKGFLHMGKEAKSIGANTFQFFSRNPRGSAVKAINMEDIAALRDFMKLNNFTSILAHAPYTMNPCSADKGLREFALNTMAEDIKRMEYIPNTLYNFHPGSHVKQGVEVGIEYIVNMLNKVLKPSQSTIVLLETMAGKGSEIGRTFEELKTIIDGVNLSSKLGICLDTCHIYSAGYDIVNDLDGVIEKFDQIIGLEKLQAVHLNDSKNPLGCYKDRHEKIGQGYIGIETITAVINHPKLCHLPFLLETPNEIEGYAEEIKMLKSVYKN